MSLLTSWRDSKRNFLQFFYPFSKSETLGFSKGGHRVVQLINMKTMSSSTMEISCNPMSAVSILLFN
ncbi:hypothetical protein L1987_33680 [Smallanthus sonchifolius]|uniref:Uncharacterized protein n=1 Tax=Smallanthus sonchifolius TaxID=185202 RepID=A0ACB9HRQ7_9ASTR|nr:hypothetical protein L1987_33680 [Smallanthus sonchifolius]